MTQFLALFAVGTWLFWTLFILFSISTLISLETKNSGGWLTGTTIMFILLFSINPITWAGVSWTAVAIGAALYVVAGAIWSIFKWWMHLNKTVAKVVEDELSGEYAIQNALSVRDNKGKITCWVAYWPWSVFWALTHGLFELIFDALRGIYHGMSVKAEAKIQTARRLRATTRQTP